MTPEFAEICGMHAGDGHLRFRGSEFEMSGHVEEREYYDDHVIPLFNKVFGFELKGRYFQSKGTYGIRFCSWDLKYALQNAGFTAGRKSMTVRIPKSIIKSDSSEVRCAFLRGLFDADGCISFTNRKNGKYSDFKRYNAYYPRMYYHTTSNNLAEDVCRLALIEGFTFKLYKKIRKKATENCLYALQMVGVENIVRWFQTIDPKNSAKSSRYYIWKMYGFCPTLTTYEERVKILKGDICLSPLSGPVV